MPVTSVTDLVALLAGRRRNRAMLDHRTGLPYSWTAWMQGWMPAPSAFAASHAATAMAQRPRLQSAQRPAQSFWQALLWLLRWQGDDPPPRDQRGIRWLAAVCSIALHLLFAVLLVWVALVRSSAPETSAEAGERVQVEYIGRGTPQEEGGGAPAAQGQEQAAAQAAAASAASQPQQAVAAQQASPANDASGETMPAVESASTPAPEVPAEQPLQVTETTRPTTDFVLPAATVAAPELRSREPQVRERTVETPVERPTVVPSLPLPAMAQPESRVPQMQVRERQIDVAPREPVAMARLPAREAEVRLDAPAVRERQIEIAPLQEVAMNALPTREVGIQVRAPEAQVRERQVPGVAEVPATAAKASGAEARQAAGDGARATSNANGMPGREVAASSNTPSGNSPGAGPAPQDRSGGWAAPVRADDWGASSRRVDGSAGGQADAGRGLFNADGSVRLAGDEGQGQDARRGAPGGDADSWTRERIAQSGTWLKRPPYDYTPTSFDKYWVPNESLLAEWVRKGVKNIEIPIPGTNTRISCVVSMLQFGGGCGLSNPNMQEQPAEARPPPDIPFKQELQEDNGSR